MADRETPLVIARAMVIVSSLVHLGVMAGGEAWSIGLPGACFHAPWVTQRPFLAQESRTHGLYVRPNPILAAEGAPFGYYSLLAQQRQPGKPHSLVMTARVASPMPVEIPNAKFPSQFWQWKGQYQVGIPLSRTMMRHGACLS
jgi:hypothetical protein